MPKTCNKENYAKIFNLWFFFSLFIVCFLTYPNQIFASESGLSIQGGLRIDEVGIFKRPRFIQGNFYYQYASPQQEVCFALPYNSPDFGWDRLLSKHLELLGQNPTKSLHIGGNTQTKILNEGIHLSSIHPHLIKVNSKSGEGFQVAHLEFSSTIPWQAGSDDFDWFIDQFYPVPLENCPDPTTSFLNYDFNLKYDFEINIGIPQNWDIAPYHINSEQNANLHSDKKNSLLIGKGQELNFVLTKEFKRHDFSVGETNVHFLYRNDELLKLKETAQSMMEIMNDSFFPYPFKDLWIIESSEIQRGDLPGIIAINTPRQAAFSLIQSKYLNWSHWNLASQLAQQWFGADVKEKDIGSKWLNQGIADFLAQESLKSANKRYNLINIFDVGFSGVSLNYLEVQNLMASILSRNEPKHRLCNENLEPDQSFKRQNPLLFIKLSIALRHLKFIYGKDKFFKLLKKAYQDHQTKKMSPQSFYQSLLTLPSSLSSKEREEFESYLKKWLTTEGWPDYSIEKIESESLNNQQKVTRINIQSKTGFDFPVPVTAFDDEKRTQSTISKADKNQNIAEFVSDNPIDRVVIDKDQSFYDSNRFDNQSNFPDIQFFPGNATSFRDDAYTVLWLPYPIRRPGEGFSLGIQIGVFKYLNASSIARIERDMQDGSVSGLATTSYKLNNSGVNFDLLASQSHSYFRLAEANTSKLFHSKWHQKLNLKIGARMRDIKSIKNSERLTFFIGTQITPRDRYAACSHVARTENEYAPRKPKQKGYYLRNYFNFSLQCQPTDILEFNLKLFYGLTQGAHLEESPLYASFDPQDLNEARIRLDQKAYQHTKLQAYSLDVLTPFRLGIPEKYMVLSRRSKLRVFYDFGIGGFPDEKAFYRASGTGIFVPFGGDLSGIGSIAISQLSLMGIFYSSVNDKVNLKPRVLLDFTGQL